MNFNVETIVRATKAKQVGGGFLGYCPAHTDKTPSLSIRQSTTGKLLLHCFAGCSFVLIIARVRDLLINKAEWKK